MMKPASGTQVAITVVVLLLAFTAGLLLFPEREARVPAADDIAGSEDRSGLSVPSRVPIQLEATVMDSQGRVLDPGAIYWESSDSRVATIDSQGVVTGRVSGTTRIVATAGGLSDTARVTVLPGSSEEEGGEEEKSDSGADGADARLDSINQRVAQLRITVDSTITLLMRQIQSLRHQREALRRQAESNWEKAGWAVFSALVGLLLGLVVRPKLDQLTLPTGTQDSGGDGEPPEADPEGGASASSEMDEPLPEDSRVPSQS